MVCFAFVIITALAASSYGKMCPMAKKKRKPKKFSAVEQVKAMARAQIGTPRAGQRGAGSQG